MNEDLKKLDKLIADTKKLLDVIDAFLALFKDKTIDELDVGIQENILDMMRKKDQTITMLISMIAMRKVIGDFEDIEED